MINHNKFVTIEPSIRFKRNESGWTQKNTPIVLKIVLNQIFFPDQNYFNYFIYIYLTSPKKPENTYFDPISVLKIPKGPRG